MMDEKTTDFKMEIGVNFDGTARASFDFNGQSATVNYKLIEPGHITGLEKSAVLDKPLEMLANFGYEDTADAIEEVISAMNSILFEIGKAEN